MAEGIYRIPLPLPMDGLKAVNVYVIETGEGLTLIDGGWAIQRRASTGQPTEEVFLGSPGRQVRFLGSS